MKNLISPYPSIDVRDMKREGKFPHENETCIFIRHHRLAIDWIKPGGGGNRPFLVCPECGERHNLLFDGGDRIGCRVCLKVAYRIELDLRQLRRVNQAREAIQAASQYLNQFNPAFQQACEAWEALAGEELTMAELAQLHKLSRKYANGKAKTGA